MSGLPRPSGLQPRKIYKKSTTKVTSGGTSTTNITETTTNEPQQGQGLRTLYAQPLPRGPSSTAGMSRIGQPARSKTTTTNVNVGGSLTTTSTSSRQYVPSSTRLPSATPSRLPAPPGSRLPAPPSRIGRPSTTPVPPQAQPRVPRSQIGQQLAQGYPSAQVGQPIAPRSQIGQQLAQGLPSGPRPAGPSRLALPRAPGGAIPRTSGAKPKVVEKKSGTKKTVDRSGAMVETTTSSTNITRGGVQEFYEEESKTEKYGQPTPRGPRIKRVLDVDAMTTGPMVTPGPRSKFPPVKDYRLEPVQPGLIQDDYDQGVELQDHVEHQLLEANRKSPRMKLKATGTKQTMVKVPVLVGSDGTRQEATKEIISKKSVIREPGKPEIISHHMTSVEGMGRGQALRTDIEVQKVSQAKKPKKEITEREVISVTDFVVESAGMKLTQKTVTYDAPEKVQRDDEPVMPSLQEVVHMIEEENVEVEKTLNLMIPELKASRPVTYDIRKKVETQHLTATEVALEQSIIPPSIPNADECQDDPAPELIANIMNTEENGLTLGSHPSNMHKYLFPDMNDAETLVEVNSAMMPPLQNVVVPSRLPATLKAEMHNDDMMAAAVEIEAKLGAPIPDNIYVATVGKTEEPAKNTARGGKRKKKEKPLTEEVPPWGDIGTAMEPLADVAGASMNVTVPDESQLSSPEVDIEYCLQMEAPKHTSRVQLRGSTHPSWFPGYLMALPNLSDLITVVKSPSVVFTAAWRATQPDIFTDESLLVV